MRRISEFSSVLRTTWGERRPLYMTTNVVTVPQMETSELDWAERAIPPPSGRRKTSHQPEGGYSESILEQSLIRRPNSEHVGHRPCCLSEVLPMHCQREVPDIHDKVIPYCILPLPHLLSKPPRFRACLFHRPA